MARPYKYNPAIHPTCTECKKNKVAIHNHYGKKYYRKACHTCLDKKYKDPEKVKASSRARSHRHYKKWRAAKMNPCTMCGFMPKNSCQMDWDHMDGDRHNDVFENMQLLCANCHRLKTWENRDYVSFRTDRKFLDKELVLS